MKPFRTRRGRQAGSAMVEFALSLTVFCVALIAVVEFARFMLLWNTAAEASALASRLASLCDTGAVQEARIREKVRYFVEASGQISVAQRQDWLILSYSPANCTASNCTLVEARLSQLQARLMIPASSLTLSLPAYRSVQVRESMRNVIAGESNNSCDGAP